MREFDEAEYANLVKDQKVVALGQPAKAKEEKPSPLIGIKEAIQGTGIKDAIHVLVSSLARFLSFEKLDQERNDLLSKITTTIQTSTVKEWVFEVERNKDGFIERIKATRR